ncbi:hypothetical protein [Luteipulveratus halotolerans]|uniref:Uncharacterized protein n=1 Tax=Luteipulveratus halotolerans TaxID=1631356 RepID=A0A0L6CE89_9MICO|nr:hypothetical protein [Luteipulveratus halotolerans]KNX35974.1 hypothetical protein VV01_00465 [Luteipulveratus halotolerans]
MLPQIEEKADAWLLAWPASVLAWLSMVALVAREKPLSLLTRMLDYLEAPTAWGVETAGWVERHETFAACGGVLVVSLVAASLLGEDADPLFARANFVIALGAAAACQAGRAWAVITCGVVVIAALCIARRKRNAFSMRMGLASEPPRGFRTLRVVSLPGRDETVSCSVVG